METEQVVLASFASSAGGSDKPTGQVCMWNLKTGQPVNPTFKEVACDRNCLALLDDQATIQPDSHFLTMTTALSSFQIFSFVKERPVSRFFGHERVCSVTAVLDYVVAGASNGTVLLWQLSSGELLNVIPNAHFQAIRSLRANGHYFVTGGDDGIVKVWDLWACMNSGSCTPKYTLTGHSQPISDLQLGMAGGHRCRMVSAAGDGLVLLWDLLDGSLLGKFLFPSAITSVTLDASELVIYAGSVDGNVYVLDMDRDAGDIQFQLYKDKMAVFDKGNKNALMMHSSSPVTTMTMSVDDRIVIVGYKDGGIKFWDAKSMQTIKSISGSGEVTNLACLLKSPLTATYKNRQFAQLKRQISEVSSSVTIKQASTTQITSSTQNNPENDMLGRLASANKELFNFIITQAENNK